MLLSLHIENIAVIERADIRFDAGFNVLTGETGAGKSMVIDALNAVLGGRVSRDSVRTGSDRALVSALFGELSPAVSEALAACGCEPDEDGLLLLERQIGADGKGSARVNGRPTTAAVLREAGRRLVNIHGQHENQALLDTGRHVDYLDRLGELAPQRARYAAAYAHFCEVRDELEQADMDEASKARRIDMLRYQIEEIDGAQLQAGEEERLQERRTLFRHAEKIADSVGLARALLYGDDEQPGALAELSRAVNAIDAAGRFMPSLAETASRAQELLYELEGCAEDLQSGSEELEFDERERDDVETRLDLIRRLTMKYGATTEQVLAFGERCHEELDAIERSEERLAHLTAELSTAQAALTEAAAALTKARQDAARHFTEAVAKQLAFMDMPRVRLEVSIQPTAPYEKGADAVEFRIAANPGEPARSIAKIASGGELSRIMLAIQSVLADVDDMDTLVFDEVDAGISGRAARKVGIKLRQTATGLSGLRSRQVLCVTHLAQIAAQAQHHLLIEKTVRDDRTYTEVRPLNEQERERELARIISGEVTEASLQAARELLEV